ncbi:alpha-mannosidase, partial [Streptococcus pyogenes]
KQSGVSYQDLLRFEDCGDIGNEYISRQPNHDQPFYADQGTTKLKIISNTAQVAELEIQQTFAIPVSADKLLQAEMEAVIDITERQSGRSQEKAELTLTTLIRMEKNNPHLQFTTSFDNQMTNHRLRVLFPTHLKTD